ncbi:MAG: hypothetical protein Q4A15_04390 [Prevotellaceae bacterium]|nr:hypothetical protein [Prevotellaceae bacterium]
MKKKYSKPTLKSRTLECSRHILNGSEFDMTPEGGRGGDWIAGAKYDLENTEPYGW